MSRLPRYDLDINFCLELLLAVSDQKVPQNLHLSVCLSVCPFFSTSQKSIPVENGFNEIQTETAFLLS